MVPASYEVRRIICISIDFIRSHALNSLFAFNFDIDTVYEHHLATSQTVL